MTGGIMRTRTISLALLCLAFVSARAVVAQEVETSERDPAIALGFAFLCPGCGHLYSGEMTKGAVIASISIASVATGLAVQLARQDRYGEVCSWDSSTVVCGPSGYDDLTPILVGGAIGLAGYLYGLVDAVPSARRMNARIRAGFGALDVKPTLAADGSVRTEIGFRMATRW